MKPQRLAEQLKQFHCTADVYTFRRVIEETFNEMFPHTTDEQLLYQPRLAMAFDDEVRRRLRSHEVPDEIINRTLINLRKSAASRHKRDI